MTQFDDDARQVERDGTTLDPLDRDAFDDFGPDQQQVDSHSYLGSPTPPPQPRVKPISADYFAIVDTEDWPIAGLIVLVDRRRQAVRAELHLYEDGERQNEYALRQAQNILTGQFFSTEPVQLQVMQSYPWRETLEIQANAAAPAPQTDVMAIFRDYWQYIMGAAALLFLIFFIWLISSFFRSPEPTTEQVTDLPAQTVSVDNADNAGGATNNVAPTAAPFVGEQTNGLGPSVNADPDLAIGKRARVQPGITVSLVSEPVPEQDKVVGFWNAGEEGLLIDGPVRKQGTSDTIVWWRVRLDNGTEAWAPANTSDATLLRVAQ